MKSPKQQVFKQDVTETTYSVLCTMPKFRRSPRYDAHYVTDDYEKAVQIYKDMVRSDAGHLCIIDTKRIIGLYRGKECLRQVVIESFDKQ